MKRTIFRYLMIIDILVILIVYVISYKIEVNSQVLSNVSNNVYIKEGGNIIDLDKETITVSNKVKTGEEAPLDYMYMVEEGKAYLYSLSFIDIDTEPNVTSNLDVGTTLKKIGVSSDQIYLIFRETYPNISLEDMGVETEEEAYLVRQLAIWEVAARTSEAKNYTELSRLRSIKEAMGDKVNENVFNKAGELIKFIENYNEQRGNIVVVPTLTLDNSNLYSSNIDEGMLIGPYKYDISAGKIEEVNVSFKDENGEVINAKITDSYGYEIKDLENYNGKDFYVMIDNIELNEEKEIEFNFSAKVKRLIITIYEDNSTDYVIDSYMYNDLCVSTYIDIN